LKEPFPDKFKYRNMLKNQHLRVSEKKRIKDEPKEEKGTPPQVYCLRTVSHEGAI
jgi:hypothetical protein